MSKALFMMGILAAGSASAFAGDDKELEEALDRFKKSYANPSAPARAAAVSELARTQHEKVINKLAGFLGGDVAPVRKAAALGLGGFIDYKKQVTPMLLGALGANAKEPEVMEAIFQALGKLDDDNALGTIHRYFDDKDSKTAGAAILAAAEIRNLNSVDLIIDTMKKYEKIDKQSSGGGGGYGVPYGGGGDDPKKKLAKEVLPATIKAMQIITREKWTTSQEWQIWWTKHKATFKIEK